MENTYDKSSKEFAHIEGLQTKEALDFLHSEILNYLQEFEAKNGRSRFKKLSRIFKDGFGHKSHLSTFRWTSALLLVIYCICLIISRSNSQYTWNSLVVECVLVVLILFTNSGLMLWETHLRYQELPTLTQKVVSKIKSISEYVYWEESNYPHLHSPLSPCITVQWTKRDDAIVNLPWSLLVKGDVIILKPGQRIPGKCHPLGNKRDSNEGVMHFGEIYSPYLEGLGEGFTSPKARTPLHDAPYLLLETPFLINLEVLLSDALKRPVTVFNRHIHYIFANGLEFSILPVLVFLVVLLNIIRYYYNIWSGHFAEAILLNGFLVALPLIPIGVPVAWVLLNWLGTSSILAIYHHTKEFLSHHCVGDPFEGEEVRKEKVRTTWRDIWKELPGVICGTHSVPIRSVNLTHVLASVSNLCCLDKKGILSWPNPTAEKLFFLKNRAHNLASKGNLFSSAPSVCDEPQVEPIIKNSSNKESECVLMSLTHDHLTAFGLQFDDVSWRRHIPSLKPLGLNVLLNTCNPATQNHYTKFCSHITCEAMYNEDLVPVSQRRCLCELPKQMGFRSRAQEPFNLEHQLCTFRHVPLDMACKDRLARSLSVTKLKFPFPHMVSVLLRDKCSGKLELMSQGTADIILDSCTDYWDGTDICPLTDKDRKKILDFYHRTSLSAYCTAFSYRPTSCSIKQNLTDFYMELPLDPSQLYQAARTPTPHISTEALFGDTKHTEYEEISDVEDSFRMQCKQIFIGMVTMQYQAKTDMVRMIEELEESCIRFVHFSKENELRSRVFSEKMGLESGWNCHISLLSDKNRTESGTSSRTGNISAKTSGLTLFRSSNEDVNSPELNRSKLRTGLEISRALSHSAPSAINLEVSQVKFEEAVSVHTQSTTSSSFSSTHEHRMADCTWSREADSGTCIVIGEEGDNDELRHLTAAEGGGTSAFRGLRSPSMSELSTSSSEQSASLNLFDMSNRARLPKGIENIRPHLENVDNVPLLVSLFTDCTTPTTRTMVGVMQEYQEVVVLMGSVANVENMTLFMKADLSLGIDPLHPQVCMREPVFLRPPDDCGPPPMEVAGMLNSLPCSLSFYREDRISLGHLILKSRHFMQHYMSCFQFWACCSVSVAFLQFIATTALLPPILSSGDILWLICIPIPCLSVSLVFSPTNEAVMNEATGKNKVGMSKDSLKYIWLYYASKFAPSILVSVFTTIWTFSAFCQTYTSSINSTCDYVYPTYVSSTDSWGGWGSELSHSRNVIQKTVSFQVVLYFCVISLNFVHRNYQLWQRNPFSNKVWTASLVIVLLLQIIYTKLGLVLPTDWDPDVPALRAVPWPVWSLIFVWPPLLLLTNEYIKKREIRVNVRYQKRAKLEFGTKLGMNSPF